MNGVLLLDKPTGMSSNHALQKARRLLDAAKAGHCGTLDPLASGLLPLAFGEATKFSADLLLADKAYETEAVLGKETDTGDITGNVLGSFPVDVSAEDVAGAASRFLGRISQVPPMYSALKRNGVPLYRIARRGGTVEREPREVAIHAFDLVEFSEGGACRFFCRVSKGTYIRTLIEDLGRSLGCGATMTALRRVEVAGFSVSDAVTLEALERASPGVEREAMLRPPDVLMQGLPVVELAAADASRLANGQRLALGLALRGRTRVYERGGRLLGTATVDERGVLSPERLISNIG